MEKKKIKTKTILIILAIIALILLVLGTTYADYISKAFGNANYQIAKWHVKIGELDISSDANHNVSTEIELMVAESDKVAEGKIAPEMEFYSIFTIDPLDTEVEIEYTIQLGEIQYTGTGIEPDINIRGITADGDELTLNKDGTYKGIIPLRNGPVEIRIIGIWDSGAEDYLIGGEGKSVILPLNITVEQSFGHWKRIIDLFDFSGTNPNKLHIGDFVTYDAGIWTQKEIASLTATQNGVTVSANNSTSAPNQDFQFGGFTVGTSRNEGVIENWQSEYPYAEMYDNDDSENKEPISGWRVFDVDEETGTLILISAGNPEDYYHPELEDSTYGYASEYILTGNVNTNWTNSNVEKTNFTVRDWSMYINESQGATNARLITRTDLNNWYTKYTDTKNANVNTATTFRKIYQEPYKKYQTLIDNHTYYWLSAAGSSVSVYDVGPFSRRVFSDGCGDSFGVRLLVYLDLSTEVATEPQGTRTVTVDGMQYRTQDADGNWTVVNEYEGTTQTYNIWTIKEDFDAKNYEDALELYDSTGEEEKMLHIGDFVEYDAGIWTREEVASVNATQNGTTVEVTSGSPSQGYQFGYITEGNSKNVNALASSDGAQMYDNDDSENATVVSGWRVFDIDEETGVITLISAGNLERYCYDSSIDSNPAYASQYILTGGENSGWSNSSTEKNNYTVRDWSMYVNEKQYAESATSLKKADLDRWYTKYLNILNANTWTSSTFQKIYSDPYKKYTNMIDNHTMYWLGYADTAIRICRVRYDKRGVTFTSAGDIQGIRVLVTLQSGVRISKEPTAQRTVTLEGLMYEGGTHDSTTVQNYNVWKIKEK